MGWNEMVIAQWEAKWLDPDYDMVKGRYITDDEEDEAEEEWLDYIDE